MKHLVRSTLCLMLAICLVGCVNAKQDSAGKFAKTNVESNMREKIDASTESIVNTDDDLEEASEKNSFTNTESIEREDATIMKLYINDKEIPVIWEDNRSVLEIMEEVAKSDITVAMSMYSNNEQVGSLGRSFTSNNKQTTTHNGDIVLYNSSNIVIFYGSNSWSYTRLGKIDLSEKEVTDLLSNGDVTITIKR